MTVETAFDFGPSPFGPRVARKTAPKSPRFPNGPSLTKFGDDFEAAAAKDVSRVKGRPVDGEFVLRHLYSAMMSQKGQLLDPMIDNMNAMIDRIEALEAALGDMARDAGDAVENDPGTREMET